MDAVPTVTEQAALGRLAEEAFGGPAAGPETLTVDHLAGEPAQASTAEALKTSERGSPGTTEYSMEGLGEEDWEKISLSGPRV